MGLILPSNQTPDPIPEKTRELMLAVFDGEARTLTQLHFMSNLERVDEVLTWLVKNKITGKKFLGWLQEEFDGSLLDCVCDILRRVNREILARPLIHGKDIR